MTTCRRPESSSAPRPRRRRCDAVCGRRRQQPVGWAPSTTPGCSGKLRRPSAQIAPGTRRARFRRARDDDEISAFLWLLGSALLPLLADEVPDLAARIRYVDRATGSDGITREPVAGEVAAGR